MARVREPGRGSQSLGCVTKKGGGGVSASLPLSLGLYFLFLLFCLHPPTPRPPPIYPFLPLLLCLSSTDGLTPLAISLSFLLHLSPSLCLSLSVTHFLSLPAVSPLSLHFSHLPPVFISRSFPLSLTLSLMVSLTCPRSRPFLPGPGPENPSLGPSLPSPSSPGGQGSPKRELGPRWPREGRVGWEGCGGGTGQVLGRPLQ